MVKWGSCRAAGVEIGAKGGEAKPIGSSTDECCPLPREAAEEVVAGALEPVVFTGKEVLEVCFVDIFTGVR